MQVEDHRMPLGDACERGEEPGGERVRVDGERDRDRAVGSRAESELGERVMFEQRQLPGEAHDGGSGIRRPRGLRAHHEHATELLFERLHALRDRRRREPQPAGGRVEGALVDDDGKGAGQVERNLHL
jgi:hypothetical protein